MAPKPRMDRRKYLHTASGAALATLPFAVGESVAESGDVTGEDEEGHDPSRSCDTTGFNSKWALRADEVIMPDTRFETGVYVRGSDANGPTAVIVAGQHGDEIASQHAALQLTNLVPQVGQLVIIPLANVPAIKQHVRATEYGNLNRDWPSGRKPTSELARAIWDVITSYNPDVAFDLHTSKGLWVEYPNFCQGVGQAIFPTRQGEPTADQVIDALNEYYIEPSDYPNEYEFVKGNLQVGINPLLSHKYAADLNIPAWLVETTECETALFDQTAWHTAVVTGCLKLHGFKLACDLSGE